METKSYKYGFICFKVVGKCHFKKNTNIKYITYSKTYYIFCQREKFPTPENRAKKHKLM